MRPVQWISNQHVMLSLQSINNQYNVIESNCTVTADYASSVSPNNTYIISCDSTVGFNNISIIARSKLSVSVDVYIDVLSYQSFFLIFPFGSDARGNILLGVQQCWWWMDAFVIDTFFKGTRSWPHELVSWILQI